jgi:hypothetical protein
MLYVEDDRLILLMYCDGGKNRARLAGTMSTDGKTATFDFLDVSGGTKYGYMHHAVFTFIDTDHHTEDWTYMMPTESLYKGTSTLCAQSAARAKEPRNDL